MKIVRATEKDNLRLCEFFSNQKMSGKLDFKTIRKNFFLNYKILTDDFVTLYLTDSSDNIIALASLLFIKGFLNNEEQTIAFATDLRVSKSREAIQNWAKFFIPEFDKELTSRNCKYTFSALEIYENETYNALVRPRNLQREIPRYFLFRRFDRVFIHGFWPIYPRPINIKFRNAKLDDIPLISGYIKQKSIRKPMNFYIDENKILNITKHWPNFKIDDFILAFDDNEKIIGCVAPFRLNEVQNFEVLKYDKEIKEVVHAINSLSWLGITKHLPKVNQQGNLLYLTHLNFDNPDIFYALINQVHLRKQKNEIITYEHFHGNFETKPPLGTISSKIPYGLFSVLPDGSELPEFLRPNPFIPAPDFPSYFLA